MNNLSAADVQHACTVLSSPALIRLITEIDDNGPIPTRALSRTLADLPVHHLHQTTDRARALGLLRIRPGAGLSLTTSGSHLADVYDATASWARRHGYPAPVSDFTSRIQDTLAVLTKLPILTPEDSPQAFADASPVRAEAAADLAGLRNLLEEWLHANPQLVRSAEHELAA
ncbi:hypothetical protein ACFY3J_37330 [Streptomyces sp. NPDC001231]|uniref:hypothetical protein n=1 Tax=Streptomyces sp. NPDC001231 TaxID=3364549 RepID=UPI0036953CA4